MIDIENDYHEFISKYEPIFIDIMNDFFRKKGKGSKPLEELMSFVSGNHNFNFLIFTDKVPQFFSLKTAKGKLVVFRLLSSSEIWWSEQFVDDIKSINEMTDTDIIKQNDTSVFSRVFDFILRNGDEHPSKDFVLGKNNIIDWNMITPEEFKRVLNERAKSYYDKFYSDIIVNTEDVLEELRKYVDDIQPRERKQTTERTTVKDYKEFSDIAHDGGFESLGIPSWDNFTDENYDEDDEVSKSYNDLLMIKYEEMMGRSPLLKRPRYKLSMDLFRIAYRIAFIDKLSITENNFFVFVMKPVSRLKSHLSFRLPTVS